MGFHELETRSTFGLQQRTEGWSFTARQGGKRNLKGKDTAGMRARVAPPIISGWFRSSADGGGKRGEAMGKVFGFPDVRGDPK